MKYSNFIKQQQELEQKIQKKLDECFDNYSQEKQYELFELLIKKRSVYKIINKNAFRSPRFIEFDDLKQETYSILDKFIQTGIKDQRKRQLSFFITRLDSSINNLIRKLYGIKRHDETDKEKKNKQYSQILNYTIEDQLENPIVQFDKILDPNQELMKEIKQEELITKIKFAKLSKNEETVIKLAFQIDENNKFSQTMNSLNNQEIADFINKKEINTNYSIRQIETFKNKALKKLYELYQPKEEVIIEDPTTIRFEKTWHKLNGKTGKKQRLIKIQKLNCINKIDEKGQLLGSKQFYADDKIQRYDEYSNGELIRTTVYLSDNKTINYVNTFNPKKDKLIDDFKQNELLKNQTLLNEIKTIIALQKIVVPTPEEKTLLKKLTRETKKTFKLEKKEFIKLINSIETIGIKTKY